MEFEMTCHGKNPLGIVPQAAADAALPARCASAVDRRSQGIMTGR